jgi:hypothetical protein
MNDAETIARLEREIIEAHRQVLERDQRVHDLTRQNVELRAYVDAILKTKAWKAAEAFRRTRRVILRRPE